MMIEWPVILLGFWKTLVLIYDVISLPVFLIIQKPWVTLQKASRIRSKLEIPYDPYSPRIKAADEPIKHKNDLLETQPNLGSLYKTIFGQLADRECYGYRKVLGEEEEKQPNGKIFKKLILDDDYTWVSYHDANDRIEQLAAGLVKNGVKPDDRVILFAETRPEWMLCSQAIFRTGATLATLYATLGDDGITHGINETEVTHVITSYSLVPKLLKLKQQIPGVKCFIYMDDPLNKSLKVDRPDDLKIISLNELQSEGKRAIHEENLVVTSKKERNDVAILMYTSGSTGTPKAVMISHKNFMSAANSVTTSIINEIQLTADDVFLAYLPQAHIFELVCEMTFLLTGVSIAYSSAQTMTDTSTGIKRGQKGDISLARPTIMPSVPLILDRIRKTVIDKVRKNNRILKGIFEFSLDYKTFWTRKGFKTPLVDKFVFARIKAMMGGRLKYLMVGGAPLSPETQEFAGNCLDCKVLQGYAATECTSGATVMDTFDLSFGRVGAPLHGVKLRLIDWREGSYFATDKPNPRGEIIIGGDGVTEGYYKNDAQTKEVYFEEYGVRWWSTGDIGEVYPDGTLKIIDRKKDLVKLQHGEYISLGKVEAALSFCDYVDNLCVYGDSFHNNVIALIVPNKPALLKLASEVLGDDNNGNDIVDGNQHQMRSFQDLCADPKMVAAVKKSLLDHGLKSGLQRVEIPTEIKLCREEWIPDNGLVTSALKIRRKQIQEYYHQDIIRMYSSSNNQSSKTT